MTIIAMEHRRVARIKFRGSSFRRISQPRISIEVVSTVGIVYFVPYAMFHQSGSQILFKHFEYHFFGLY